MKYKDYYKTLGLARGASDDDIKKAYRRLARKYHPDVSKEKDAEERFKEIAEAYDTLKDPRKRAAYDGLGAYRSGEQFRPGSIRRRGDDDLGLLAGLFLEPHRDHGRIGDTVPLPVGGQDLIL